MYKYQLVIVPHNVYIPQEMILKYLDTYHTSLRGGLERLFVYYNQMILFKYSLDAYKRLFKNPTFLQCFEKVDNGR